MLLRTVPLALFAGSLGCSDPVYYPSLTRPLEGRTDTGAAAEGIDLTGIPCSPEVPGPTWLYAIDNQHPAVVLAHRRESDCSLSTLGTIDQPQAFDSSGLEGEIFVFTDEAATTVLAWVEVLPNDAAAVVIP